MRKRILAGCAVIIIILSAVPVSAQTPTPLPGPVYIVQSGDTLWDIAINFNVSVADIMAVNNMSSQDIFPGNPLVIPGLEGLSGSLIKQQVRLGENLVSLGRQYQIDPQVLIQLNHIVSPAQIYAGKTLILLQNDKQPTLTMNTTLVKGETPLELAVLHNTDPWTMVQVNQLIEPAHILPGDTLLLPEGSTGSESGPFPYPIKSASLDPLPLKQGATVQIKVNLDVDATLSGTLMDHPLHFFPAEDGSMVALQGVHAMADPGIYPLELTATLGDGSKITFEQMVLVISGNYLAETINGVDPATIDPAVTAPEDEWLKSIVAADTPEKYWQGLFQMPVDSNSYCLRSTYGKRRTYNGGALHSFHSGIDYGICSESHPFDIYAPAAGVVVYTGLKVVRGNVTIIDHGNGVYSGLYHQAEIYVSVGDHVQAGQRIGKIGATGRVTGPHVHWDLFVNGIQVNPADWLNIEFPH